MSEEDDAVGQADNGNDWTADDERIYRDNLDIVDNLHWESYRQKDELKLAHHLIYHQGEEIRNQSEDIKELKRMVRIALDSAQAAKGAVVQVLADMTALERGSSPYHMASDSRRPTEGPSTAASSSGPLRMVPTSKRAPRGPNRGGVPLQVVIKAGSAAPKRAPGQAPEGDSMGNEWASPLSEGVPAEE